MSFSGNLEELINQLKRDGICKDDVRLVESKFPGLITDEIPLNGFTDIKTTVFLKQVIKILSMKQKKIIENKVIVDAPALVAEISKLKLITDGISKQAETVDAKLQHDIAFNKFLIGYYVEIEGEPAELKDYADFDVIDVLVHKHSCLEHLSSYKETEPLLAKLQQYKDVVDVDFLELLQLQKMKNVSFKDLVISFTEIILGVYNLTIEQANYAIKQTLENKYEVDLQKHFNAIQTLTKESNILVIDICFSLLRKQ